MEEVFLIGRILFVYLLIGSGVGHLTQTAAMAGYAESRGVPYPKLGVRVSGIALVVGGLSILLGIFGDLGAIGIAALMVITAVLMHAFWKETDATAKMTEMVAFNKDIALAGGALAFFVLFRLYDDIGGYTITGALFG